MSRRFHCHPPSSVRARARIQTTTQDGFLPFTSASCLNCKNNDVMKLVATHTHTHTRTACILIKHPTSGRHPHPRNDLRGIKFAVRKPTTLTQIWRRSSIFGLRFTTFLQMTNWTSTAKIGRNMPDVYHLCLSQENGRIKRNNTE